MLKVIHVCVLSTCFAVTCSPIAQKGMPPGNSPTRDAAKPKLSGKLFQDKGFKPFGDEMGVYDIDRIKFGELCDLLGCRPNDFGHVPGSNASDPDSFPLEYDGGDVRSLAWHLTEETLNERDLRAKETLVKACVILYDKSNPRPVIKRVIQEPHKKPKTEYETRPKPKN